jgi:hypothetical protein
MRRVCDEYDRLTPNASGQYSGPGGQAVPRQIVDVASAFLLLQKARHRADYDTASTVTHIEADTEVMRAEVAFLDWAAARSDPEAETFLVELLCRGIPKR